MLAEQRQIIDQIDQQMVQLLEQRFDCAKEVAKIKKENHLPILDASREQILLDKIKHLITQPEYMDAILEIYAAILKTSKEYQASQNN